MVCSYHILPKEKVHETKWIARNNTIFWHGYNAIALVVVYFIPSVAQETDFWIVKVLQRPANEY